VNSEARSLDLQGLKAQNQSPASSVSKKLVDPFSRSEFALIPQSASKRNINRLIPVANASAVDMYATTSCFLNHYWINFFRGGPNRDEFMPTNMVRPKTGLKGVK